MLWPFVASFTRLIVAAGGAWWLAGHGANLNGVFACAPAGAVLFGAINFAGLLAGRPRSTPKVASAARS